MQDLFNEPTGYRIELDYQIDGEYIFTCWDNCDQILVAASGDQYEIIESRFEWLLLELGIFL